MNQQFLHAKTVEHSRIRRAARDAYNLLNQWEGELKDALDRGDRERISRLKRSIADHKPQARRLYARHKAMEKKLLALTEKFYQRFPALPLESTLAHTLDLKREAYRATWKDPMHDNDNRDADLYICPECRSTKKSSFPSQPDCRNEFCTREGERLEPLENYMNRYKYKQINSVDEQGNEYQEWVQQFDYKISEFSDGSMKIERFPILDEVTQAAQIAFMEALKQEKDRASLEKHNAQRDLERLQQIMREGRLYKRIQQYRDVTTEEPSLVAA